MSKPFFEMIKDQLPEEITSEAPLQEVPLQEEKIELPQPPRFQFERVPDTEDFEQEENISKTPDICGSTTNKCQNSILTDKTYPTKFSKYLQEVYVQFFDEYRLLPEVPVGWARIEKEDNPLVFNKRKILNELLDNLTCLMSQVKLEEDLLEYKTKLERIKDIV